MDSEKKEESTIIFKKTDFTAIKYDKTKYALEFTLANNNINLGNIVNFDLISLVFEINKTDIFEDFKIEIKSETSATAYILFKHFFEDFGIPQKYAQLDINITKIDNQIIFTSKTNYDIPNNVQMKPTLELIPIDYIKTNFTIIAPNKIFIRNITNFCSNIELPDFIEKLATTIIIKIFLRTKQFIEKMCVNI